MMNHSHDCLAPLRTSLLSLLLLLAGLAALPARTINLPDDKFSIDIPDAWVSQQVDGRLLSVSNTEKTTTVYIVSFPNTRNIGVNEPGLIKAVENGLQNQAQKKGRTVQFSSENPVTLNGVPAYCFQGSFNQADANPVFFRNYALAGNGKIYVLSLLTTDTNDDTTFQGVANSLTFQSPPVLPEPSHRKYSLHKIAYFGGAIIGVIAVVLIFVWLRKKSRS